jgi:hypothetical protein
VKIEIETVSNSWSKQTIKQTNGGLHPLNNRSVAGRSATAIRRSNAFAIASTLGHTSAFFLAGAVLSPE